MADMADNFLPILPQEAPALILVIGTLADMMGAASEDALSEQHPAVTCAAMALQLVAIAHHRQDWAQDVAACFDRAGAALVDFDALVNELTPQRPGGNN